MNYFKQKIPLKKDFMQELSPGTINRVVDPGKAVHWVAVTGLLYIISLKNYLLFHHLIELFSVLTAYMVFVIVWKAKNLLENRYLLFIGIAYMFIGVLDFLRTLSYEGMEVFPGFDANLSAQLWIIARYLESASLFIAPIILMYRSEMGVKLNKSLENVRFSREVFITYAGISGAFLISIFVLRNFPDCYIPGFGLTRFKIISEYIISLTFFCSLVLLYKNRDKFEDTVFKPLTAAIVVTILGEIALIGYTNTETTFNFIGHCFKLFSFYLIYKAIIETGFEEPCNLLFRELKQSEEAFRQEATFLREDHGRIYSMLGVKKGVQTICGPDVENPQESERSCHLFMQNFQGIGFQLDRKFSPIFMHGAVEEITGYSKKDFLSGNLQWEEIVLPADMHLISEKKEKLKSGPKHSTEFEYRILRKDGEVIWVREIIRSLPGNLEKTKFQGSIYDITERKMAEEALEWIDKMRIKEIHHRVKNNLQVISSLLSLQAEKFGDREVIEAFQDSQSRIISMAVIHEELYKGDQIDTLDFAAYLRKLTADLFRSYRQENKDISLKLDLEEVYLGMDTAIPLGIIVNELVSNSLKHAFQAGKGEIRVSLSRTKSCGKENQSRESSGTDGDCKNKKGFLYTLSIADNTPAVDEDLDIKSTDSLWVQLINVLVEQIEGCIKYRNDTGNEFKINFSNI